MKYYVIDIDYSQTDKVPTIVYAESKEQAISFIRNKTGNTAKYYNLITVCNMLQDGSNFKLY